MVVTMAQQRVVVFEMVTNRIVSTLQASSGRWSVASGAAGSIEATIPPADFHLRDDFRTITEPVRMGLAIMSGDSVLEAGPIWSREWNGSDNSLSLHATGLRSIFDHRLLVSHLADWHIPGNVAASVLSYSGLSLGTIAARIVAEALAQPGGTLPVVLPDDAAGTHERTYPGYELATVEQRLSELSAVQGGPEIAFDPRLTADRLGIEWVMRVGTEEDPALHQVGADWVVDTSVPRGSLGGLRVSEDASSQVSRAVVKGPGTDAATLISVAALSSSVNAGYPLLDTVRSATSDSQSQNSINQTAFGDLYANEFPWQKWDLTVRMDDSIAQVRPGDWWSVRVGAGSFVPRGTYRARLASMSGELAGETVSLSMVPTQMIPDAEEIAL